MNSKIVLGVLMLKVASTFIPVTGMKVDFTDPAPQFLESRLENMGNYSNYSNPTYYAIRNSSDADSESYGKTPSLISVNCTPPFMEYQNIHSYVEWIGYTLKIKNPFFSKFRLTASMKLLQLTLHGVEEKNVTFDINNKSQIGIMNQQWKGFKGRKDIVMRKDVCHFSANVMYTGLLLVKENSMPGQPKELYSANVSKLEETSLGLEKKGDVLIYIVRGDAQFVTSDSSTIGTMVVFETVILAGALGLCVGYKLEDNPLYRCQSKQRGETPEGYTNETFQETPSECIYFCKPYDDGQWYIGKIEDGTECQGRGVQGKCKSGYCVIAGNEQIPPTGIEHEKPGPLPAVAAPSDGEVGGPEATAPGPSDNTEIGGAETKSPTAEDTENEEPPTGSSGGDQLDENGPTAPPGELPPSDEESAHEDSEVNKESSSVGQPSDDDDDDDEEI
uniref:Uncharacterized protein n=1 Tax=Amblyomma maculatum TaxID=34609 RepID=G3MP17_AMBMU